MSIAMSSRLNLPTINSGEAPSSKSSTSRTLPPLSALLNSTSNTKRSISSLLATPSHHHNAAHPGLPLASPKKGSIDLSQHSLSTNANIKLKTPIRLPSFDTLDLTSKSEPSILPLPSTSRSFSFGSSRSQISPPALPTPSTYNVKQQQQSLSSTSQKQTYLSSLTQESPLVEKRSYAFISHSPSTYPSQEPSIDNAQLARRKRRRTTPRELAILFEEFEKGSTPNRARRVEIASRVDMNEKAVQIWFQNRRQTLRRQTSAEREVHHLEPIYTPIHPSQSPHLQHSHQIIPVVQSTETPVRHQPIVFSAQRQPTYIPQSTSYQSSSSPVSAPLPHPQQVPSLSPTQSQKDVKNDTVLVTPSRTTRASTISSNKKSSPGQNTLTFKLTKSPILSTVSNSQSSNQKDFKLVSNPESSQLSMTPVVHKQRQKPIMKVNPSPPRNFKSDIESNKENIPVVLKKSEDDNVVKTEEKKINLKERKPLGELNFNVK